MRQRFVIVEVVNPCFPRTILVGRAMGQQAIAARSARLTAVFKRRARLGDERIHLIVIQQRSVQGVAKGIVERAAQSSRFVKRQRALCVPAGHSGHRCVGENQQVDVDGVALANAVKAADTLLKLVGMGRQIKHNEVVTALKVAAFRAYFRANQQWARRSFGHEGGGGAIAFDERHLFMKHGNVQASDDAQRLS